MSYRVTYNGKYYELPKCTLEIEEKIEKIIEYSKLVEKGEAKRRELVELMLEYVENILGVENTKEILGYNDINDVDTKELEILIHSINSAYTRKKDAIMLKEAKKSIADIENLIKNNSLKSIMNMMSAKK